jgi:hypothetical protein
MNAKALIEKVAARISPERSALEATCWWMAMTDAAQLVEDGGKDLARMIVDGCAFGPYETEAHVEAWTEDNLEEADEAWLDATLDKFFGKEDGTS